MITRADFAVAGFAGSAKLAPIACEPTV